MSRRKELVTFLVPEAYLDGIERLVELGRFKSRSEAVRSAIKDIIKGELWRAKAETKREMPVAEIKV